MKTYRFLVHDRGPALWPEHKPLEEVVGLRANTPEQIWEASYQGNPTPPSGTVFKREWWPAGNRFKIDDKTLVNACIARWISFDTAMKDRETSAYSAAMVGELWPDYRMALRFVWRGRLDFPDLVDEISQLARRFNQDGKLRGVIIEDKASGISAYQTLNKTSPAWLRPLLVAFMPSGDKPYRASQASVYCKNGSLLLPFASESCPWLYDFEDELFNFPGSTYMDQVDSFSQLVLYTENLLAEGYEVRHGK